MRVRLRTGEEGDARVIEDEETGDRFLGIRVDGTGFTEVDADLDEVTYLDGPDRDDGPGYAVFEMREREPER